MQLRTVKSIAIMGLMAISGLAAAQTKVITHRGYWNSNQAAQNSLQSLQQAHAIHAYGSEFDVYLTADGVAVINHDATIGGLSIETSTYAQLKDLTLSNGEKMPTLEQYLQAAGKLGGTQLILEIKPHKAADRENEAVKTVLALVKKHKLQQRTDYISFSHNICSELIRQDKKARVAYLKGDLSPAELQQEHFYGLDYHHSVFDKHPEWIKEAKQLGLTVNVWTVNDQDMMRRFVQDGADFITTDQPEVLTTLLQP
jgi:glycerophosphoryl diester phosphodiesterase